MDSSRHIIVRTDALAEEVDYASVALVVLPGGRLGTENLSKNELVLQKCREFALTKKVAAICAAPSVLAYLGLLEGKCVTCHPDYEGKMQGGMLTHEGISVCDNIITGQGLGVTFDFAFKLVEILLGKENVNQIKSAICYRD